MIVRYEVSEIAQIWSDQHRFKTYLKVELAVLKALGDEIPPQVLPEVESKAKINCTRIRKLEQQTHHDVTAFCTSITENLNPEIGKYFHYGVTSSDIIDTSLALMMKESGQWVQQAVEQLKGVLWNKARQYKDLPAMGRSHGIYAEPLSFGQKLLGYYRELQRRERDLQRVYSEELTGQISGAVGNYTIISRKTEAKALETLGLAREPLSTQVIPRDHIAKIVSTHALLAAWMERLAVELRHLQRSEVAEVHEGFAVGQQGSSTMPHKKNPISSENLTGITRVLRSHVDIALENCVLWHERDISHSSAERLYLPDNFGLLVYALRRLAHTLEHLVIDEAAITKRVEENFSYLSSYYLHHLIKNLALSREQCYAIVQTAAFEAKSAQKFHQLILRGVEEKKLTLPQLPVPSFAEIKRLYLREVDELFKF